ncbi:hypothetical protein [Terriglobus aquaticus]|uniref:YcxB-like protein domain-containing protein n=1 Tax=Terriglobus aquaticus TaxID=940139 RepID=A0ABW9KGP5_9BACT|nr:hypothetical protein [Terriglobus aquaticus]
MVVRFTWRPAEWREAYLLSRMEEDRSEGVPMAYLIAGLMGLGGVGDLFRALSGKHDEMLHDRLWPALLLVSALALAVMAALALFRRRERLRQLPAVPRGEQQVTLHEMGWGAASDAAGRSAAAVRGWSELRGLRTSRRVLALLTRDGQAVAVPLRALTKDQGSWVERLLLRKVPRLV